MDSPIADSTAATVTINTASISPVKLVNEDDTIKKFKETERSIISIDISTSIILDLLTIIPNKLIIKRINGNVNKEYTILIPNPPLLIRRLVLKPI